MEKVKQDKNYFFNAPKQLISYINCSEISEDWIFKGAIEKYSFKNIDDINSRIYIDKQKAEDRLSEIIIKKRKENEDIKKANIIASEIMKDNFNIIVNIYEELKYLINNK